MSQKKEEFSLSFSPSLPDLVRREENDTKLKIVVMQGDLISQQVGAIVNAANDTLLGGGGIDFFVHKAAGPALFDECKTLGGCKTGNAKITGGHQLEPTKIIHAVGPQYPEEPDLYPEKCAEAERLMISCHQNILRVARENKLTSIAIPAISTGIFGYPPEKAADVVSKTIVEDLNNNGAGSLQEIRMVLWEDEKYDIYRKAFTKVLEF